MLHIATVHFGSPRWIPIQARELRRHITVPFQTWSSVQGIDRSYGRYFDHVLDQGGDHAGKLNHLALEIAQEAGGEDLLMFLDGDAFPIADPTPLITSALGETSLMAVRRAECLDDAQPHPCFCVTRVSTWLGLGGDWSAGYAWVDSTGKSMSDVGANLLRRLELSQTPWTQVLRSNRHDLHPLFFAVYGDVIYHHGAGFRNTFSRVDRAWLRDNERRWAGAPGSARMARRRRMRRNARNSEALFKRIQQDDEDWLAELT